MKSRDVFRVAVPAAVLVSEARKIGADDIINVRIDRSVGGDGQDGRRQTMARAQ